MAPMASAMPLGTDFFTSPLATLSSCAASTTSISPALTPWNRLFQASSDALSCAWCDHLVVKLRRSMRSAVGASKLPSSCSSSLPFSAATATAAGSSLERTAATWPALNAVGVARPLAGAASAPGKVSTVCCLRAPAGVRSLRPLGRRCTACCCSSGSSVLAGPGSRRRGCLGGSAALAGAALEGTLEAPSPTSSASYPGGAPVAGGNMEKVALRTGVNTLVSHQEDSASVGGRAAGGPWQQSFACATARRSFRSSGVRRDDCASCRFKVGSIQGGGHVPVEGAPLWQPGRRASQPRRRASHARTHSLEARGRRLAMDGWAFQLHVTVTAALARSCASTKRQTSSRQAPGQHPPRV